MSWFLPFFTLQDHWSAFKIKECLVHHARGNSMAFRVCCVPLHLDSRKLGQAARHTFDLSGRPSRRDRRQPHRRGDTEAAAHQGTKQSVSLPTIFRFRIDSKDGSSNQHANAAARNGPLAHQCHGIDTKLELSERHLLLDESSCAPRTCNRCRHKSRSAQKQNHDIIWPCDEVQGPLLSPFKCWLP